MKFFLNLLPGGFRVFNACLLPVLMLTAPLAATNRCRTRTPADTDGPFTAIGNTLLVVGTVPGATGPQKAIAGNLLTNDTEYLGDSFTISTFDATSANGGTVNVVTSGVNAGSFSYISAANFTGTNLWSRSTFEK